MGTIIRKTCSGCGEKFEHDTHPAFVEQYNELVLQCGHHIHHPKGWVPVRAAALVKGSVQQAES